MKLKTSIVPWLSVRNSHRAAMFYKAAFGATEVYRMEAPDGGLVLRLSVEGAEFWISGQSTDPDADDTIAENIGGDSIKIILTVDNPDNLFDRALKAGAKEVFSVAEGHGWRLGRLSDPFGLHWEIGKPLKGE